jgi:hypothetical protein
MTPPFSLPPPYHLLFALGVIWGAAWVIADSKITLPFRRFIVSRCGEEGWAIKLLECPACTSFWIGTGVGFAIFRMGFPLSFAFGLVACGLGAIIAAFTFGADDHE